MSQRLDAWLSDVGLGSRSQVRKLIRGKRITVNGTEERNAAAQVDDHCQITLDGETLAPPRRGHLHIILHKPSGYACSDNPSEAPLASDLLESTWRDYGVNSVGRLDRDTSGLLLFTSDGQWLHRLIHPKRKVPKRYRLRYQGHLDATAIEACANGIQLADDPKPCRPAELILEEPGQATMILHEGRYHQVKRMIAACGATVSALHRDRFGGLDLPPDLSPGNSRELTSEEITAIG